MTELAGGLSGETDEETVRATIAKQKGYARALEEAYQHRDRLSAEMEDCVRTLGKVNDAHSKTYGSRRG